MSIEPSYDKKFLLFPGFSGEVRLQVTLDQEIETITEVFKEPILITVASEPSKPILPKNTDVIEEVEEYYQQEIKDPLPTRLGRIATRNYYAIQYRFSSRKKNQYELKAKETLSKYKVLAPLSLAGVLLAGGLTVNAISANDRTEDEASLMALQPDNLVFSDESSSQILDQLPLPEHSLITAPELITETSSTTTSTTVETSSTTTTELVTTSEAPTVIGETLPAEIQPTETSLASPPVVDIYSNLNCSQADAVIEKGWTMSEIAGKCGLSLAALKEYNPQISDFNSIVTGTRISLQELPVSSSVNVQKSSPLAECVSIGGVVKPLQIGFTVERYLKNLGYSNEKALFLAYETSLASDYGLEGSLIAGNKYCHPTVNGISIRYSVNLG
jgi:LysM repeat protein